MASSKLPFFQFYPSDWIRDTRCLSANAKAAWIDILALAWNEPRRGVYKRWPDMMVRELGIENIEVLQEILAELDGIADINQECDCEDKHDDDHVCPGIVTVVSRRMLKEERVREIDRKRQQKHRRHGDVTTESENVTREKSEVRSQKSEKKERFIPPTPQELEAYAKDQNLPLNVSKFFDHYASKGWFVGRRPMKDWRAAARLAANDWAKKADQEAKDKAVPTWM